MVFFFRKIFLTLISMQLRRGNFIFHLENIENPQNILLFFSNSYLNIFNSLNENFRECSYFLQGKLKSEGRSTYSTSMQDYQLLRQKGYIFIYIDFEKFFYGKYTISFKNEINFIFDKSKNF